MPIADAGFFCRVQQNEFATACHHSQGRAVVPASSDSLLWVCRWQQGWQQGACPRAAVLHASCCWWAALPLQGQAKWWTWSCLNPSGGHVLFDGLSATVVCRTIGHCSWAACGSVLPSRSTCQLSATVSLPPALEVICSAKVVGAANSRCCTRCPCAALQVPQRPGQGDCAALQEGTQVLRCPGCPAGAAGACS